MRNLNYEFATQTRSTTSSFDAQIELYMQMCEAHGKSIVGMNIFLSSTDGWKKFSAIRAKNTFKNCGEKVGISTYAYRTIMEKQHKTREKEASDILLRSEPITLEEVAALMDTDSLNKNYISKKERDEIEDLEAIERLFDSI